ncbi:MAG: hypothetical protein PHS92_01650 [Candidatus Gracilibacteria bacterium]|nr:hypothetical protein [Candidatus Gracilibacteria bacterium]
MNYLILKSIIEATIANFKCKNCDSGISEGNLNILGTAGNNINMEIVCPNCKVQGVVKAEFGMLNNNNLKNPDFINNLKTYFNGNKEDSSLESIKDEDILNLRKGLNNSSSIEDFFKK